MNAKTKPKAKNKSAAGAKKKKTTQLSAKRGDKKPPQRGYGTRGSG